MPECSRAPRQHGQKSNQRVDSGTRCCLEKPCGRLPLVPHFPPESSRQTWPEAGGLRSRCVDPPEEHICYDILSLRFGTIEQLFHTLPPLFMTHGRQGDISKERLKGRSLITSTNIALAATLSRPSVTVCLSALKIRYKQTKNPTQLLLWSMFW